MRPEEEPRRSLEEEEEAAARCRKLLAWVALEACGLGDVESAAFAFFPGIGRVPALGRRDCNYVVMRGESWDALHRRIESECGEARAAELVFELADKWMLGPAYELDRGASGETRLVHSAEPTLLSLRWNCLQQSISRRGECL